MAFRCSKCGHSLEFAPGSQPGRTESCEKCHVDLHSCVQCAHYDESAYNQCRESQADRVVEKERSNFCDYFSLSDTQGTATGSDEKDAARKKLDDLFS